MPPSRRFRVIVNKRAGTTLSGDEKGVVSGIRNTLQANGADVDVVSAKGGSIARALEFAALDRGATVVLAGGDGTVSRALPLLTRLPQPPGAIGLGTLNLFPRDLGMIGAVEAQAKALLEGEPREVDLATINGRPFHSISGLGYFGLMAREREQMRESLPNARRLGFLLAMMRSAARTFPFNVTMDLDGDVVTKEAFAVVVTNNRFHGTPWKRDNLAGGHLEIIVFGPQTWSDKTRLAWSIARGKWRDDRHVEMFEARKVTIDLGRPMVSVSTDGELRRERNPIVYEIKPRALSIITAPAAA